MTFDEVENELRKKYPDVMASVDKIVSKCSKCKRKSYCDSHSHYYKSCVKHQFDSYLPFTNADKIRHLTDAEQMADYISKGILYAEEFMESRSALVQWLDKEATE